MTLHWEAGCCGNVTWMSEEVDVDADDDDGDDDDDNDDDDSGYD